MQVKDLQLKRALRTALFVLLLGAGMKSFAERVEPETAQRVAASFLRNNGVRSNQLNNVSNRAGFSNLYIFNGEPGFVILAADDCVKPILGYSLTGRFVAENMPANLRWWLQGYNDEIQYAIANQVRGSIEVSQEWDDLKRGEPNRTVMTTIVEPLIESTWGQGDGYNDYCPYDYVAGERTVTGCAATAMAQIMRYWGHPTRGEGYHSYQPQTHPEYGFLTVYFRTTIYDWSNMPNSLSINSTDEEINAVAKLMYHCGVSVNMNYGPEGSSAFDNKVPDALKTYFGYSKEAYYSERNAVNDDVWINALKYELDAGRPVYYGGDFTYVDENNQAVTEGHAFVCDGYSSDNYFHFNWGWDGDLDDYYSLNAMTPGGGNYNYNQDAIFGIQPEVVIGDLKYIFDKQSLTATVVGHKDGISATGSLNIPSSVTYTNPLGQTDTYEVASINDQAFAGCRELTGSLIIPNSVEYIGDRAFSGCSGFNSTLTIGNSVALIGDFAFAGCIGLTSVYWDAVNVSSYYSSAFSGCTNLATVVFCDMVQAIPNGAFYECSGLTSVTIGNSVESIGVLAFNGCSGLTTVHIPDSVESIGYSAFSGCSGLTTVYWNAVNVTNYPFVDYLNPFSGCTNLTTVVFGNMVQNIPGCAFYDCSSLTGVLAIPNSVTSIGGYAFQGCSFSGLDINMTVIPSNFVNSIKGSFSGALTIGDSVTTIEYSAFYGCNGLTSLTLGNSLTSIGVSAFYDCSGLTGDLVIPNSVTSIGNSAFRNCSDLTSLTLGSSVTSVGDYAFENCSGLNTIYWNAVDLEDIWTTYPHYFDAHPFRGCANLATVVFGEMVQTIPNYALSQCAGLTLVTIGNSVTTIGASAFSGCSGLTGELVIPNSVTSIGANAFSGCSGLTGELVIPNSVTSIGAGAFRGCNGLTGDLIIPGSVTSISPHAFEGCAGGNLIISNGVISIGEYAFYDCSGFTGTLSIGNSLTEIGYAAFENCSGFSGDLIIPNSVTSIEEYAFDGCSGLNGTLSLPNALAKISHAAFANCGFVGELILPNTITSIELNAFLGCNGFSGNLVIPNSVTTIESGAFRNCSGFTGDLVIPNSVIAIENGYGFGAFQGCSGLSSIYSYGAVPPIAGQNAFNGIDFSIPVYVPSCSATEYAEAAQWSNFTNYQAILPCVPTFTGNDTDNLWSNPDNWSTLPDGNDDIIINAYCEMDMDVEASKIIINNSGIVVVKSGYVLTVGEIINRGSTANVIIEDGGQLVYNQNGLQGTVLKDISSYNMEENDGWHLIAYPLVENGMVASQSNMLSNSYDLYYYDEPTHYWINQKDDENNFTLLESGKGYLYANQGFGGNVAGSKIGEGTSTIGYTPFYTYYEYTIAENLFLATELEVAGLPTTALGGLCWYATNQTGYLQSNISIWMANVNDDALTTTSHNVSGMTLVYTGEMTPVVGWNSFVFNENNFTWDGTSNVLVCVQRNNGTYNSTIYWQAHNPGFASTSYKYNISSAYDMTSETYSMNVSSTLRPNIIFQTLEQVGEYEYYEPITMSFAGEMENGAAMVNVPLSYTETAGNLRGFNLVGNPFVHNVTTYASTNVAAGCFRLNEAKDNLLVSEVSETQPLHPAEGFFVKATDVGASITFNPGRSRGETARKGFVNLELRENGKLIDRLIVKREGEPLEKLSLKGNSTRLYAMQNKQEVAIVSCDDNEQPVNFKATKNGSYMITASLDNMAVDFLHLIDNLTGADVDLLVEPSYTFEAKTSDYASRFKLVFSVSGDADGDDAPFAFINNGNIIIIGAEDGATLQMVDVLGHVILSGDAMNRVSTNGMTPGVYVLRLINGEEVKTQKIVVE